MVSHEPATIEWFGATTYRLRARGLTISLDTWLDRPSTLPLYLSASSIKDCDYISISHARFDHLPGADTTALATGATVIANGESINKLGVPQSQPQPVAGGETIALGAPGSLPEELDSGAQYVGGQGTMGVTKGTTAGFSRILGSPPAEGAFGEFQSWLKANRDRFSFFDGGQLMFSFEIPGEGNLLWSSHVGGYEGILKTAKPERLDVVIMGIAGRPCLDGVPFDGSPAEFVVMALKWLKEPGRVVWCLQDEQPLKPVRIRTETADRLAEEKAKTKAWNLAHHERTRLFQDGNK